MKLRASCAIAFFLAGAIGTMLACSGEDGSTVATGKDAGAPPGSVGQEGGPCRATGTGCDPGLVCVGEVCAKPGGPGANDGGAGDGAPGTDGGGCASMAPTTGQTCAVDGCFCQSTSTCFARPGAVACCGGPVSCTTDGTGNPDAGACTYKHPLLDAGARFCGGGECYCGKNDSCYSLASVTACCAGDRVVCY